MGAPAYSRQRPLITVQGLNLWLGKGQKRRHIIRDLNQQVCDVVVEGKRQGQVVGLLGPSGIGKSQFFGILAGFTEPSEEVVLEGTVLVGIDQQPPKLGQVGVVSQHYRVLRDMTVLQNLIFAGRQRGLTAAEAKAEAEMYLERFCLMEHRDAWPARLSGGQRQRIAILQQAMVGHLLILMDEPFSGLDPIQVEEVIRLIHDLTADNELMTIFVVTHDVSSALLVADTLWMMGRERDEAGNFLEGASIVAESDLAKEGFAWNPDIRHDPRFGQLEAKVIDRFRTLVPSSLTAPAAKA